MNSSHSGSNRVVLTVLGIWFGLALAVGATGMTQQLRPPAPQIVLGTLTILALGALWFIKPIHSWAMQIDLRVFVAFHLTRFVGIYFLFLYQQGELPYEFAVHGGWGDILVATLAIGLLAIGPAVGRKRLLFRVWNIIGLADILFVVATAARLALVDPESMAPLLRLPLALLPTFVVPIIIASHVWLFGRLVTAPTEEGTDD